LSLNNALNTNETYNMTDDLAQQDETSNNQFVNFNQNQNEEHTLNLSQRVNLNTDHDSSNGAEYAIQDMFNNNNYEANDFINTELVNEQFNDDLTEQVNSNLIEQAPNNIDPLPMTSTYQQIPLLDQVKLQEVQQIEYQSAYEAMLKKPARKANQIFLQPKNKLSYKNMTQGPGSWYRFYPEADEASALTPSNTLKEKQKWGNEYRQRSSSRADPYSRREINQVHGRSSQLPENPQPLKFTPNQNFNMGPPRDLPASSNQLQNTANNMQAMNAQAQQIIRPSSLMNNSPRSQPAFIQSVNQQLNNQTSLPQPQLNNRAVDPQIQLIINENNRLRSQLQNQQRLLQQQDEDRQELLATRKNLTKFSGEKKEDLQAWLVAIERYMYKARMPEHKKSDFALEFLTGKALRVFNSIDEPLNQPWSLHVRNLQAYYMASNTQSQLRTKLRVFKQTTDILEHVSKFDSIMNEIIDMSETDKINYFIESLCEKTADAVNTHMPDSLIEAKEVAIRCDKFRVKCRFCDENFNPGHRCSSRQNNNNNNRYNNNNNDRNGGSNSNNRHNNNNNNRNVVSNNNNNNYRNYNNQQNNFRYSNDKNNQPDYSSKDFNGPTDNPFMQNNYKNNYQNNNSNYNNSNNYQNNNANKNNNYQNNNSNQFNYQNNGSSNNNNNFNNNNNNNRNNYSNQATSSQNSSSSNNSSSNQKKNFNNLVMENKQNDSIAHLFSGDFIGVAEREPAKLIKMNAELNNHEANVVLDIGATTSVCSEKAQKEFNIPLSKETSPVTLGNGMTIDANLTEPVSIVACNRSCKLRFLVTPLDITDVLLGMDWFNQWDVWVHPKNKTLKFESETYLLQESEKTIDELYMMAAYKSINIEDDPLYYEFNEREKLTLNIEKDLCPERASVANDLLNMYSNCFANNYDELGRFTGNPIKLEVDPTARPVYQHYYSVNDKKLALLKTELAKQLRAGLIRPSRSEWGAPAFFVLKDGGTGLRMVINYKAINKHIKKFHFPIRKINDILQRLAGATIFSVLDMKAGYMQFALDENSKQYTAFTTPIGHFEYNVAPFGISNIPSEFAKFGVQMFGDLEFCEIYYDDNIVFSKSFEEHVVHLEAVLKRFNEFNVRLNPEKCHFFKKEVKILGHLVNAFGISMNPEKINAIMQMKLPDNVSQLELFIGLVSYYRKFIRNCAHICAPLHKLTHKDERFILSNEAINAFNECKRLLTTYPILRHADPSKPYTIYTDASGSAMGAILSQFDDSNEYVVHFASKKFNGHELSHPAVMKEAKAMMFGVSEFYQYIEDSRFTLVVDHSALQHIEKFKDDNLMIMRWFIILNALDCNILYRKGSLHTNVDALSRLIRVSHDQQPAAALAITRSSTKSLPPHKTITSTTSLQKQKQADNKRTLTTKDKINDSNKHEALTSTSTVSSTNSTTAIPINISNEHEVLPNASVALPETQSNSALFDSKREKSSLATPESNRQDDIHLSSSDDEDECEAEDPTKSKDPFINSDLHYYIMHQKTTSRLSAKQSKRIIVMAEVYNFNGLNILYAKDKKNFFLIVPPLNKRSDIITIAHLVGHFRVQSTYDKIRERYYWPKLFEMVKTIISRCLVCIRNETSQSISHLPAQVITVSHIFDIVSVDLIFGLSLTVRGNKGICNMIDHLTGFVMSFPIKSKEAKEIAEKLWIWISIFGPMKTLLSDRGGEFLNATVTELLNLVGTEHRVTSSFHPSCNGTTEKSNGTLVKSLRKHAEADPYNWDLYLSFVTFAYNTRVHSITRVAPYTGVFGILCNNFDDYDSHSNIVLAREANINRIKNVFENVQTNIVRKRNEFASTQKVIQDNSHKIAKEPFKINDLVTVKAMKIQGKMQPKFNGIFRIDSITSHGNYKLKNNRGELLKQSFLHSRLKKIPNEIELEEEEHLEVESLLNHRTKNGELQYLTLWKDGEQSWEPEYHFDTTEVIEDYWSNIRNKSNSKPLNNLLLVAKAFRLLGLSSASVTVLSIFFLISLAVGQTINENFKFCDVQSREVWNLPTSCQIESILLPKQNNNFFILSKAHNEFDALATVCAMKHIQVTTFKGFLMQESFSKSETIRNLNAYECELMNKYKKCGEERVMTCVDSYCESTDSPNIEYIWLQTKSYNWNECQLYTKRVIATKLTDRILLDEHTFSPCRPIDLFCQLHKSTLIWSKDQVDLCPFKLLRRINLDLFDSILVSDLENKLFQITKTIKICNNITAYDTAEGFALTIDTAATRLETAKIDIKIIDGLLLTEMDFNKRQQLETILRSYQATNQKICQLYRSFINLYSKTNDEFFVFSDFNGNEAVIYSFEGRIYVPQCTIINQIKIVNSTRQCYHDIPILINFNNKTITAFLTQDKVIRLVSKTKPCINNKQIIHFEKSNQVLVKNGNSISIMNEPNFKVLEVNLQHFNISSINFMAKHDSLIITSIDVLKNSLSLVSHDEINGMFHVIENEHSQSNSTFTSLFYKISDINSDVSKVIHNIILYIVVVTTAGISAFISTAFCTGRNAK